MGEIWALLKKVVPLANLTRELGFSRLSLKMSTIKGRWLLLFLFLIFLLLTLLFLLLRLTKDIWLVVMWIRRRRKGRVRRRRIRKRKSRNHLLLMVLVPREHSKNPKFPCKLYKADHLLKECPGLSHVQEECSKRYKLYVSSTYDHHVDDTPSTSDPLVKGRKGKVLYPCLICNSMHRTFLCPSMDESFLWLENIRVCARS